MNFLLLSFYCYVRVLTDAVSGRDKKPIVYDRSVRIAQEAIYVALRDSALLFIELSLNSADLAVVVLSNEVGADILLRPGVGPV